MRTRIFQKIAFFALALITLFSVSVSAAAQGNGMHSNGFGATIHGVPPSVTSFGFGGRPGFHGVPASVTSLNFGNSPLRINHGFHQGPFFQGPFSGLHRHRNPGFVSPFYGNVVAVPYAYPVYVMDPGVDDSMEEEDYRVTAPSQPAPQAEVANQPRTVLVFKDGRRLEILNYAIVGSTLYDLNEGLARKVALAELDLPATVKQNDDRGVDFQLPAGTKLN